MAVNFETQMREFWRASHDAKMAANERARQLSRQMVLDMEYGADITPEAFLFAATLGRPEEHSREELTINKLFGLKAGDFVGVVDHKERLHAVGVASDKPATMTVRSGYTNAERERASTLPEQRNRNIQAYVTLDWSYERDDSQGGSRLKVLEEHTKARKYHVLSANGEPGFNEQAFYNPSTIITGGEELMSAVEGWDDVSRDIAAAGIDALIAGNAGLYTPPARTEILDMPA